MGPKKSDYALSRAGDTVSAAASAGPPTADTPLNFSSSSLRRLRRGRIMKEVFPDAARREPTAAQLSSRSLLSA